MKQYFVRFIRLLVGLFLYSLGIVITMRANVGYAPWDVLHVGLAKTFDISVGTTSIYIGVLAVVIAYLLKEKLGVGTYFNMILIGLFMNLLIWLDLVPLVQQSLFKIPMLVLGLFVIAWASYFYIGSGFGAGPRDCLMVALSRKTKLKIGICRVMIELLVVIVGWFFGGTVGIGTLIAAFGIGICVQIVFRSVRFDATKVMHETLKETIRRLTVISLERKRSKNK